MAKNEKRKPPKSSISAKQGSMVSRYISFVMLVATILVFCFFFYNVIKGFLLPLFLAILLAVIFRPLHEWILHRCGKRVTLAATLSTTAIMLIVLLPLTGLVFLGLYEANQVVRGRGVYIEKAEYVRRSVGLQKPFANPLGGIESALRTIDDSMARLPSDDHAFIAESVENAKTQILARVEQLRAEGRDATWELARDVLAEHELPAGSKALDSLEAAQEALGEQDGEFAYRTGLLRKQFDQRIGAPELGPQFEAKREPEKRALRYLLNRQETRDGNGFNEILDAFAQQVTDFFVSESDQPNKAYSRTQKLTDIQVEYDELRTALLGGPIWKWVIELANPGKEQLDQWVTQLTGKATRWLPSITNTATSLIAGLLMGLGIMAVALFYFFLDGSKMVNTFMRLSPLDDRHELELLQEFDRVSRAVVLATLLSAVAQGILGGIGYKLVGLQSVFLLTLLTAVLALIPFVGAAAVWVPACIYVAFVQEPTDPEGPRSAMYMKAGFLAVYGFLVISMADNVIKPWVLKGQSKLHPLLALLSVLGGVQALGPIGILIGPMVVAFLQVLLTILQREISSMDATLGTAD